MQETRYAAVARRILGELEEINLPRRRRTGGAARAC